MPCSSDNGFTDCPSVPCPCQGCEGTLLSDGRNVANNLTFLECDTCHCTYTARDFPRKTMRGLEE